MVELPKKTFLQVENGVAVNAAVGTDLWAASALGVWVEATDGATIGWSWDGAAWSAPSVSEPTDAERAALIKLSRTDFLMALETALSLTAADPLVDDYVAAQIDASALSAANKRLAKTLLMNAVEFWRVDPDRPQMLDTVGAAALGLTSAEIDQLFLGAA